MNAPARKALPRLARLYMEAVVSDGASVGIPPRPTLGNLEGAKKVVVGVAYHEAAHAVVGLCVCGPRTTLISIEKGSEQIGPSWGFVRTNGYSLSAKAMREIASSQPEFEDDFRSGIEQQAMELLAGPVGDAIRDGWDAVEYFREYEDPKPNGTDDASRVWDSLNQFAHDPSEVDRWARRLVRRTERLLLLPTVETAIARVAEALLDSPTLEGDELDDLLFEVEKTVPRYVGWPRRKRRK